MELLPEAYGDRKAGTTREQGLEVLWVRLQPDFLTVTRCRTRLFVVCNPVRAGLVRRINDYPLWDAVWIKESG